MQKASEKNLAKKTSNGYSDKNKLNQRDDEVPTSKPYRIEIKWLNVIVLAYIHAAAFYGLLLPKLTSSIIIGWISGLAGGFGTTVAAHRFFTHRTFRANNLLKYILIGLQTSAAQEPIIHWARDHRVHHKFTDTNADPYNSRRGFFFSHIGWLMCKKHPDVIEQGKKVDMSDLESDPMLQFQKKFYLPMALFLNFVIPVSLACYFGESFSASWHGNMFKFVIILNITWTVNSLAHMWGDKPYDKAISPTDTFYVGLWALGEGWHNYHHVFPWDYKTAELPGYFFNLSTAFIDFFAWLGWATDLKTVPDEIIKRRLLRTGDGSHPHSKLHKNEQNNNLDDDKLRVTENFWGWGDKEMTSEDMKYVKVIKAYGN